MLSEKDTLRRELKETPKTKRRMSREKQDGKQGNKDRLNVRQQDRSVKGRRLRTRLKVRKRKNK